MRVSSADIGVGGRRERPLGRLLQRSALVIGALCAVAVLLVLYGWRYGFSPLPKPEPAIAVTSPFELTWEQVTSSNCWHWIRQLRDDPSWSNFATRPLEDFADAYAMAGLIGATNRSNVLSRLESHPVLERTYNAVQACRDRRPPAPAPPSENKEDGWWHLVKQLKLFALWRAAEAERQGAILDAFNYVIAAWQLELMPDPNGSLGTGQQSAAVWRRLALKGPLPPRSECLRLLGSVAQMVNTEPSLENAFCRRAWRARGYVMSKHLYESAPGPFALMVRLTRTNDLARMHEAYVSGVVARLRTGDTTNAFDWAETLAAEKMRGCQKFIDRPLVWNAVGFFGYPRRPWKELRDRVVQLESGRLTLALRLYREIHGNWPQTLSELVPEVLPHVPIDPYSEKPFRYRTVNGGYLLASVGSDNHPETWLLSTNRLRGSLGGLSIFGSAEPDHTLAVWREKQDVSRRMPVEMLMRYGLFPKGYRIAPIDQTNGVPANTTNRISPAQGHGPAP